MLGAGAAESAIDSFRLHYQRLRDGERGFLPESSIEPIQSLPDAGTFESHEGSGRSNLSRVVMVKLNGGLGTSMGLERAKSLLPVREELTFLDLIARQVLALRTVTGTGIPLLLMNSYRTSKDSQEALTAYPDLAVGDLPLGFLQNMVPKILEDSLLPARHEEQPELEWCPPGHGDFFTAIKDSGTLARLLECDIEYAFVSNADNLGAALDPWLLGFMVERQIDFMLEAADRTAADKKGGHLCRLRDGRLALRESAQCPPDEVDTFQDTDRYGFFNTNNLWVHLPTLDHLLEEHGGFLPLPTVVNRKNLDPREPTSPAVVQLETVMGTAISLFPKSAAVRVPRRRFSPVKNTNDLLAVRSDAYTMSDDGRIILTAGRERPPVVSLDERYFKLIDDFDQRFPRGAPSLKHCESLSVEGSVTFGAGVVVEGDAVVRADNPASIPDGTTIRGRIDL